MHSRDNGCETRIQENDELNVTRRIARAFTLLNDTGNGVYPSNSYFSSTLVLCLFLHSFMILGCFELKFAGLIIRRRSFRRVLDGTQLQEETCIQYSVWFLPLPFERGLEGNIGVEVTRTGRCSPARQLFSAFPIRFDDRWFSSCPLRGNPRIRTILERT